MLERFRRGLSIAKASWSVLKQHPRLLLLPIPSAIAILLLIGLIIQSFFPEVSFLRMQQVTELAVNVKFDRPLQVYLLLFAVYGVCAFIAIFFNAALVFCALEAFAGRTPTLRGGVATAMGRLPQILGWMLVSATVGLVLNLVQETLRERLGFLGSILGGLLEFAWAAVTYFVLPVLVVDRVGPIEAVKRSAAILKRTWGESVTGVGGLGIISFLLTMPVLLVLGIAIVAAGENLGVVLAVVVPIVVLYVLALSLVLGVLGSIFRTGLYVYATTGTAPGAFDPTLMQGAFRSKKTT